MKLPPSPLLIKLFFDLALASRRSSSGGKVLLGSLVVLSVFITISHFPAMELSSMNLAAATPATSNLPLFGNPASEDFMSYAVAIMPIVPGANLNTSNIAGSTNCDLLVPVTYIDAGCMNSLPLLFPFNEPRQTTITEPTNQTFYNDYSNSSSLDLSIGVASNNITAGETQSVTVTVSDQNSTQPVQGALVLANVTDSFNTLLHEYSGTSDEVGQVSFPFVIPIDAASDVYNVDVLASADGYENASASTAFDVIGSGDFFDNSTSDNFFDDSSSSDSCCSDSSSSDNSDFNSPTVKSTDPGDTDQNVPVDTKTITVTFSEKMDQNSIDASDLTLDFGNTFQEAQSVDVSGKTATFNVNGLFPGTNYIATISSDVQDQNGNFLDCFNSNGVDDSCQWEFSTSGASLTRVITINPTSGPVGTSVTVTGTGFAPSSTVTIKYDGSSVTTNPTTVTTNNNGEFSATSFTVPSSSSGPHTVEATTTGSNAASKSFTVTPAITLNPTSGPVGTSVTVTGTGFAPSSTVTIKYNTTSMNTIPSPVTTNNNGEFSATSFTVPSSSIGPHTVEATTTGSNAASKSFTVTPAITLNPTSGPVGTSVTVTGTGFAPTSLVTITFNETSMTSPVTPTANGGFSANFAVPASSNANHTVTATQGSNSASKTFTVTPSGFAATSRSNVSPFGSLSNQSNATIVQPPSNQTDSSGSMIKNSSALDTAKSNEKVSFENNTRPANTSSAQRIDNTSTSPITKKMNNTILTGPTDNKISENHVSSASSQTNDTSNIKKSSEKSISISHAKSKDQLTSTELTNDNTNDENQSSVREDKIITKVTSPNSDNQPEKQSKSSDSIKRDRALFFKYLNSNKENVDEEHKTKVNNRPVAINDDATTESNIPVKINILSNDKDPDGDKLSVMGVSRPVRGTIESDADGTITYSPLKSWSGTERFGYTISDGRGGVATGTVTVIVQNQPPEAEDQDISVNANSPIKIKLEAKDPDDDKLKFVLVTKPSHGRIAQFSISTGTLAYIPDENYDGKDDFAFKVHDGTVFSNDAKVSIKIEKNEKLSNDQVQGSNQQPKKEEPSQTPSNEQKTNDEKSNSDTPPNDSSQQSTTSTQDDDQQNKDQKAEEQQPSPADKHSSEPDTAPSGDSQTGPDS